MEAGEGGKVEEQQVGLKSRFLYSTSCFFTVEGSLQEENPCRIGSGHFDCDREGKKERKEGIKILLLNYFKP